MYEYPVTIHHIFISPGHNYFGRPKDGPGDHATVDVAEVEAVAGQGLAGDRYFGVAAHYDAQVTFVAWEVFQTLKAEHGRDDWSPILMRRNIVIEGVPLNQLIGQPFTLDFGDHQVEFLGAKHCAPCAWMDCDAGTRRTDVPARPRRPAGEDREQRSHPAQRGRIAYPRAPAAGGSPVAVGQTPPAMKCARYIRSGTSIPNKPSVTSSARRHNWASASQDSRRAESGSVRIGQFW